MTSPHIAGQMLYLIQSSYNEIQNRAIGDLGVGCGMLTAAACMLGSSYNVGYDIDPNALAIAKENFDSLGVDVDLVEVDVCTLAELSNVDIYDIPIDTKPARSHRGGKGGRGNKNRKLRNRDTKERVVEDTEDTEDAEKNEFEETTDVKNQKDTESKTISDVPRPKVLDTVITNPPFGTRRKGVDLLFVLIGLKLARTSVYSLHKTSTREHVLKKAEEWGVEVKVVAELKFDIPKMYSFHKEKSRDIEVDFIRFAHRSESSK